MTDSGDPHGDPGNSSGVIFTKPHGDRFWTGEVMAVTANLGRQPLIMEAALAAQMPV